MDVNLLLSIVLHSLPLYSLSYTNTILHNRLTSTIANKKIQTKQPHDKKNEKSF